MSRQLKRQHGAGARSSIDDSMARPNLLDTSVPPDGWVNSLLSEGMLEVDSFGSANDYIPTIPTIDIALSMNIESLPSNISAPPPLTVDSTGGAIHGCGPSTIQQDGAEYVQQNGSDNNQQDETELTQQDDILFTQYNSAPYTQYQGVPYIPDCPPYSPENNAPSTYQDGAPHSSDNGAPFSSENQPSYSPEYGAPYATENEASYNQYANVAYNQPDDAAYQNEAMSTPQQAIPYRQQKGFQRGKKHNQQDSAMDSPSNGVRYNELNVNAYNLQDGTMYNQPNGVTYSQENRAPYNQQDGITYNQQDGASYNQPVGITYSKENRAPYNQTNGVAYSQQNGAPYNQQDDIAYNQQDGSPYNQQDAITHNQQDGTPYNQQDAITYNQQDGTPYNQQYAITYNQQDGTPYNQQDGVVYSQQDGAPYNQQGGVGYVIQDGVTYNRKNAPYNQSNGEYSQQNYAAYNQQNGVTYNQLNGRMHNQFDRVHDQRHEVLHQPHRVFPNVYDDDVRYGEEDGEVYEDRGSVGFYVDDGNNCNNEGYDSGSGGSGIRITASEEEFFQRSFQTLSPGREGDSTLERSYNSRSDQEYMRIDLPARRQLSFLSDQTDESVQLVLEPNGINNGINNTNNQVQSQPAPPKPNIRKRPFQGYKSNEDRFIYVVPPTDKFLLRQAGKSAVNRKSEPAALSSQLRRELEVQDISPIKPGTNMHAFNPAPDRKDLLLSGLIAPYAPARSTAGVRSALKPHHPYLAMEKTFRVGPAARGMDAHVLVVSEYNKPPPVIKPPPEPHSSSFDPLIQLPREELVLGRRNNALERSIIDALVASNEQVDPACAGGPNSNGYNLPAFLKTFEKTIADNASNTEGIEQAIFDAYERNICGPRDTSVPVADGGNVPATDVTQSRQNKDISVATAADSRNNSLQRASVEAYKKAILGLSMEDSDKSSTYDNQSLYGSFDFHKSNDTSQGGNVWQSNVPYRAAGKGKNLSSDFINTTDGDGIASDDDSDFQSDLEKSILEERMDVAMAVKLSLPSKTFDSEQYHKRNAAQTCSEMNESQRRPPDPTLASRTVHEMPAALRPQSASHSAALIMHLQEHGLTMTDSPGRLIDSLFPEIGENDREGGGGGGGGRGLRIDARDEASIFQHIAPPTGSMGRKDSDRRIFDEEAMSILAMSRILPSEERIVQVVDNDQKTALNHDGTVKSLQQFLENSRTNNAAASASQNGRANIDTSMNWSSAQHPATNKNMDNFMSSQIAQEFTTNNWQDFMPGPNMQNFLASNFSNNFVPDAGNLQHFQPSQNAQDFTQSNYIPGIVPEKDKIYYMPNQILQDLSLSHMTYDLSLSQSSQNITASQEMQDSGVLKSDGQNFRGLHGMKMAKCAPSTKSNRNFVQLRGSNPFFKSYVVLPEKGALLEQTVNQDDVLHKAWMALNPSSFPTRNQLVVDVR